MMRPHEGFTFWIEEQCIPVKDGSNRIPGIFAMSIWIGAVHVYVNSPCLTQEHWNLILICGSLGFPLVSNYRVKTINSTILAHFQLINLLDLLTRAGSLAVFGLILIFETWPLFPSNSTRLGPIDLGLIPALTPFFPYGVVDVGMSEDWELVLACTGTCCARFWARAIAVWLVA
jgi:hypothetical protein